MTMTLKQRRITKASAAADILSSYFEFNELPWQQTTGVIESVLEALRDLHSREPDPSAFVQQRLVPAVSKKKSISETHVFCLECGKGFKAMTLHLQRVHGMTPVEYRRKWSLDPYYPMTSPNHSASRSSLAKTWGFGKRATSAANTETE
ncbi:MucR family transcriptional regulator [Ochrobactrum quorumnocens]|uniref:MucR family transcriptional regulator n=1 Tax=Ochrobactrum quorumnocens TaxID=271865 RepID=UPI003852BAF7